MKRIILTLVFAVITCAIFAQSQYEISRDKNGSKVLKGILSRDDLEKDTAFAWFTEGMKTYTPHTGAKEALTKNKNVELVVFIGTWCHDSHFILPKLYSLLDASGFPKENVTLIGTDRSKKTISHLAEALNVISVPTIIVMKEGKELGRVVEYGKYGLFEMELAEILK